MKPKFLIVLFFSVYFFSCKEKTLFERLDPKDTGVNFSNTITPTDTMNIMTYEYFYNGAGVGVADFNNDGLKDLYFSGNQVDNRLYLNKGNFKFEDITATANVNVKNRWCAGVTIVDINADGKMDIYVSATVKKNAKDRQNMLFVNQGLKDNKPYFKEMAAEYGVNDDGNSENASFFDYDNDGDLDLYVLTNVIDQYPNVYRPKKTDGSHLNTDRLYQCNWDAKLGHPVYKNVSKEAGITIEGYGLGLNICDINRDGFKDILVTNDYISDDLLYINNGDGTFRNNAKEFFKHTSNAAMGNDVADINNDGFVDIFSVDMLAKTNDRKKVLAPPMNYQNYNLTEEFNYNYQYMRNTLQLNNGVTKNNNPQFSEISLLAGVAETDWSWTPSLADFDNDGYRDILITNGFPKDVTDRDFMSFRAGANSFATSDFLMKQIPEVKISNYALRNKGNLQFENVTEKWGLDVPSFSNGAVYVDLDNDGDLDYVVNNINDPAFIYKNNLQDEKSEVNHFLNVNFKGDLLNPNGLGASVELFFDNGERTLHENNPYRGYLSSVEPNIHFGLGNRKVKTMIIRWYNGKQQLVMNPSNDKMFSAEIQNAHDPISYEYHNNPLFKEISDSIKLNFVQREHDFVDFNLQTLLPFKLSELGPGMSVGDVNKDGLEDVFVSGSRSYSGTFLIQKPDGGFVQKNLLAKDEDFEKKGEDLGSLLFDADGDSDLDLYICRGGNEDFKKGKSFQDVLYLNDGKGNFSLDEKAIPENYNSNSCVRALDFDNDGDLDLVASGRNVPTEYPKFANSTLLQNNSKNGKIEFVDVSDKKAKDLNNLGLICDILCTDFDNDNWVDMILVGEWSEIKFMKNNKGTFTELKDTGLENYHGIWSSINGADFDNDGDIDYVVGNIGENTLMRGTQEHPATILAKDFDKNGVYDIIPFVYFKGQNGKDELVPFNGKDDVNKQVNFTRQRFVTYKEFINANFDNLFTKEEKKDAQKLILNHNATSYIENLGNGKFKLRDLPIQVQFSTVNGIVIEDLNNDGYQDLVLSGNNYGNEITMGRLDATNGTVLINDKKGNFSVQNNTGFYVSGNAKAMVCVYNAKNQPLIFASQNRGKMDVFKSINALGQVVEPKNKRNVYYEVDGKKTLKEVYWGSSYLAQSSMKVLLPLKAKLINK